MGVFDKIVVFALNKKSPPSAAILFSFANLRLPGNFTGGLREVKTSRNLPGKLPGKLTGSKITGVSRNTRKVYGSLTGDLPGPIIYRVFRETGPWCLLNTKVFAPGTDYPEKVDLYKGYWNPQRKIGVATHIFEMISPESQQKC